MVHETIRDSARGIRNRRPQFASHATQRNESILLKGQCSASPACNPGEDQQTHVSDQRVWGIGRGIEHPPCVYGKFQRYARLHVDSALLTASQDVIAEYSFGRNYGRLDQEDFDPDYARAMHDATGASHFNKQIFWPFATLLALPPWIGTKIAPGLSGYVSFISDCAIQVNAIKEGTNEKSQSTIFHHLIESKDIPDSEKANDRLIQEAQVVVSAGTETTAWAMSVLTFYLLSNPEILGKLRKELEGAITDPSELPSLASLEQLPYLTACIQEALRFSYGLASRLQRISPEKPMVFNDGKKDWVIPPGVGQSRCTA